jgi:nucleoside-diphosphate-sugar epimerase
MARGRVVGRVQGRLSVVDVRDVGLAQVRALERAPDGGRYHLAGVVVPVGHLLYLIASMVGVRAPRLSVGRRAFRMLATATEAAAFVTRQPALLPREVVDLVAADVAMDNSRMVTELGVGPSPIEPALQDHVQWMRDACRL